MPPKGSGGKKRPHPYKEGAKQPARRAKSSTRQVDPGNESASQPVKPQVNLVQQPEPQPSTSQTQSNDRDPIVHQPSSSSMGADVPVTPPVEVNPVITTQPSQPQVQQPVSRQEFDELKGLCHQ